MPIPDAPAAPGYHEDPNTIQLHRAIGGYFTIFSEVIAEMRRSIGSFLSPPTVDSPRGNPLLDILFASMTAKPIIDSFFGMATMVGDFDDADTRVKNQLRREVNDLTSFRNDLAHADWSIGWVVHETSEPLPATAARIKSEQGVPRLSVVPLGTNDIVRRINRLLALAVSVRAFARACRARQCGPAPRVSELLEIATDVDGTKVVRPMPGIAT